jgi:hypothetical protein
VASHLIFMTEETLLNCTLLVPYILNYIYLMQTNVLIVYIANYFASFLHSLSGGGIVVRSVFVS